MDFPIPWDTKGNITTVKFPKRNVSTKFGAAPHADTLWIIGITDPSFNCSGFNNTRYEKPNLTTMNIPAFGCYYNLSSLTPNYRIKGPERTIQWWKTWGIKHDNARTTYYLGFPHYFSYILWHPQHQDRQMSDWTAQQPKESPMVTGIDDWDKILYFPMSL